MQNGQSRNPEDLHRQVAEATAKIEAWAEKLLSFDEQLPASALCTICYLADKDPHPPHVVIVLCPTAPSATITFYRAEDGYLKPADKLMTDHTAIRATVDGIMDLMTQGDAMVSDGDAWALGCLICGISSDDIGTGGEPRRLNVLMRMQEHAIEAHDLTHAEMARVERTQESEGTIDFALPDGTLLFSATRRSAG